MGTWVVPPSINGEKTRRKPVLNGAAHAKEEPESRAGARDPSHTRTPHAMEFGSSGYMAVEVISLRYEGGSILSNKCSTSSLESTREGAGWLPPVVQQSGLLNHPTTLCRVRHVVLRVDQGSDVVDVPLIASHVSVDVSVRARREARRTCRNGVTDVRSGRHVTRRSRR